MRVIYQIPNDDPRKSQAAAKAAEDAGFDGIVALENAHGPIPALTAAAMATERVQLGTAVLIAFPRSPIHHRPCRLGPQQAVGRAVLPWSRLAGERP